MSSGISPRYLSWIAAPLAFAASTTAAADKVKVGDLVDVTFGTINNLSVDNVSAQNICAHSQSDRYSVTATGSGSNNSFALSAGSASLAYEVQWAGMAGQTTGTPMAAGVASGTFTAVSNQNCNGGATASLIIVLRATQLQSATALAYSGTLSILLAPL